MVELVVALGTFRLLDHPGGLSDRVAYRAQQAWLLHFFLALHRRWGILRDRSESEIAPEALNAVWRRYSALLERDLINVREHYYPRELLFEVPLRAHLRALPRLIKNAPAVMARRIARAFMDLPREVNLDKYPPYYRQNFHWQTDGYLSDASAELYDVAVEMLFFGMADVMRRQIIRPISAFMRREGRAVARVLDVGCGTGRAVRQLAIAHPHLNIIGVDLSPYYAAQARRNLAGFSDVSFLEANGEDLPFRDGYFDVVTSTFLMHELPHDVRRTVLREMNRVLRPGGLLVIEDSAQLHDSSELEVFMELFAREFHEPYFADFLADDLTECLRASEFTVDVVEDHFVAKLVAGRKSAVSREFSLRRIQDRP